MQYNITYREKDKGIQFIISYKNSDGEWKQKSKQGFSSKKEAKRAADEMLEKLKETVKYQINTDYENITFKEFSEIHLEHLKLYKEANTIELYKLALKHFSAINNIKLIKITTLDIQRCVDNMIKKGLKHSSISTYLARIKVIFKASVEQYKIIISSPVDNVYVKMDKEDSNKKALTKAEFDLLIKKTTNPKYKVMFLLAGTCGLRMGEIIGLTWNDINFKTAKLNVNKQWKYLGSKQCGFGELKSKNSYRTVPIPKDTLQALQEFKKHSVTDVYNRVIIYSRVQGISNLLKGYFKRVGFDITIHELRHTYATRLIANGVDFKTAAKLLGHEVDQTLKTYSHVTDDMLLNASNVIKNIF